MMIIKMTSLLLAGVLCALSVGTFAASGDGAAGGGTGGAGGGTGSWTRKSSR
ncbi:hypothetical protein [Pseudomonas fluorescens]|uniref:hypothetical protein n=1 Tax=Pseudomonas fluorescens TaxID=294 RepID=UPI000B233CD2|nr:hypothetical protein [Pseudomonas fluorescens]